MKVVTKLARGGLIDIIDLIAYFLLRLYLWSKFVVEERIAGHTIVMYTVY